MTPSQHAARLRDKSADYEKLAQRYRDQLAAMDRPQLTSESGIHALIQLHEQTRDSLLAGAEALEAQGRWKIIEYYGKLYMIPVDRWAEWSAWWKMHDPGQCSDSIPVFAEPFEFGGEITGWVR